MGINATHNNPAEVKPFGTQPDYPTTFPMISTSLSIYLSIYLSIDLPLVALIIKVWFIEANFFKWCWMFLGPKMRPNDQSMNQSINQLTKCSPKASKIFRKSPQNPPKIHPKSSKIHPKSPKVPPKSLPKSIQNRKRASNASQERFFRCFSIFWWFVAS